MLFRFDWLSFLFKIFTSTYSLVNTFLSIHLASFFFCFLFTSLKFTGAKGKVEEEKHLSEAHFLKQVKVRGQFLFNS